MSRPNKFRSRELSLVLSMSMLMVTGDPAIGTAAGNAAPDPANTSVQTAGGVVLHARSIEDPAVDGALAGGSGRALAMAAADFDGDGVPDLVVSREAAGGSGILALHRGDRGAAAFFLPDAKELEIPEAGDFLVAGDFDADGRQDLAAAHRSATSLTILAGDGVGGFRPPESLALSGAVTFLACADVNRRDALEDLLVAVADSGGARLLVLESPQGAIHAVAESIELPAPAVAISTGRVDDQPLADVVVAAGDHLVLVSGRDRRLFAAGRIRELAPPLSVQAVALPEHATGLAVGDFDGDGRDDVAARLASGKLAWRFAADPENLAAGPELEALPSTAGEPLPDLVTASLGSPAGEALVAVDPEGRRLRVLLPDAGAPETGWIDVESAGRPISVLPILLNGDGASDLVLLSEDPASFSVFETMPLATFTVTNVIDSGAGSLRQAILNANASPGADLVTFSIAGAGPHTIAPATPLPIISDPVTIDATAEVLLSGAPGVVLDGAGAGSANGLQIASQDCVVRALAINRFALDGVLISGGPRNRVSSCYLGVTTGGTTAAGNRRGVFISGSSDAVVGGGMSADGNLISGNAQSGIELSGSGTFNTQIQFSKIGTRASGTARLPNALDGIRIVGGAHDNVIAFNTISGNDGNGIGTPFPTSGFNLIRINVIGADPNGLLPVANASGVSLASTDNTVWQNRISGNTVDGVAVTSGAGENVILQNMIGTKASDPPEPLPNGSNGVLLSQAPDTTIRLNFVSGNGLDGIRVTGANATGNDLRENFIGIGEDLVTPLGNSGSGIAIRSNAMGTTVGVPATPGDDEGNLIAFNDGNGIEVFNSASNTIFGNAIFGNVLNGILLSQSLTTGNDIRRNRIGVRDGLSTPMGNGANGIRIVLGASGNFIGQADARAEANIIAFNGADGVGAFDGTSNAIRSNVITGNTGLGIDLGEDGVTVHDLGDPDTGPNNRQNFPVLTLAGTSGGDVTIEGTLNSTPGRNFRVDFYSSPSCDPSGHGEGESYVGTGTVITLISGDSLPFSFDFVAAVPLGHFVTATATSLSPPDDTSEFSACLVATVRRPMMVPATAEMDASGTSLSWEQVAGAESYNLYRGKPADLPNLAVQPGPAVPNACTRWSGTTAGTEPILTETPPPGSLFWYLVTAVGAYGEGDVQDGTNGPRQIVSSGPCTGSSCPHDKCVEGALLSPSCGSCVAAICAGDPFCCNTAWDGLCVEQVRTVCNSLTCLESRGICNHTVCSFGPLLTPDCDDPPVSPSCVGRICAVDPFCCEQHWDLLCTGEVDTVCGMKCD